MRSKRLRYRVLMETDAPRIALLAGEWEVASMTARIPYPYTVQMAESWVLELPNEDFVRGVTLDGELIGAVGYYPSGDGSAEIGYWIGRGWWGRGYATEAADALVRHCFGRKRFSRLTCCHFADNAASARVIAKLGFRPVGGSKTYCEARRRDVPTVRYELAGSLLSLLRRRAA